ncbi:hypothetical protein [Polaribacter sp. SA4-12]|uniref:hypothetical protein n=1 Tax=Polaribacter sp. SA4-12 TaxID=1312072 RepID=UPI000B3CB7D1|nr:hypothetical protein [Polaribacter sp. SA4-12]ARV15605.1 hypothetical protein BTO07_10845 [Polaribacter sp. SA4-12]
MFLQIMPPDNVVTAQSIFENELVFVLLGLAVSVFAILRVAKYLSKIKINKSISKPSYSS